MTETTTLQQIFGQIDINSVTMSGAIVFVVFVLWKTGFISSIISLIDAWVKKIMSSMNGKESHESRLNDLDLQMNNHLSHVPEDLENLKEKVNNIETMIVNNKTDIAVLKSKVNDLRRE